ncbi:MAG: PfkB family carbohydrate kinase [Actinomycetota bacterium]
MVIDHFPDRSMVAGAPLHVATHLAALGWRSLLITRLGRDDDAETVGHFLDSLGLDRTFVEYDDELPTGRVTVELTEDGHTFDIHRPASWDRIEGPEELPPHDAFCFGTLSGRSRIARGALERLLAGAGPLRVLDANLRPPDILEAALRLGLGTARLTKLNDDEFTAVAARLGFESSPGAYFEHAPELEWLCITKGGNGAELYRRDGARWAVEGRAVEVIDTVGAGDAFTAGLIDGLGRKWDEGDTLAHAQAIAERVVSHQGGFPQD